MGINIMTNYYEKYIKYKKKYLELIGGTKKKTNLVNKFYNEHNWGDANSMYAVTWNLSFAVQSRLEASWPSESDYVVACKHIEKDIRKCFDNSKLILSHWLNNKRIVLYG